MPRLFFILLLGVASSSAWAACGGQNQRPCKVWERVPSCNAGLTEDFRRGLCVSTAAPKPQPKSKPVANCGAENQSSCKVWERIPSCNKGLVEDLARGMCKAPSQNPAANVEAVINTHDSAGTAQLCQNTVSALGFDHLYTFKVTPPKLPGCPQYRTYEGKLLVGIGVPKFPLKSRWTPDGCSDPTMPKMWEAACNVHDVMYATLAPKGLGDIPEQWRLLIEKALMLNLAQICRNVWTNDAPQLATCYDAAIFRESALRQGVGKDPFKKAQNKALTMEQNGQAIGPRLTDAEYQSLSYYIDRESNSFLSQRIAWTPSGSIMVPDNTWTPLLNIQVCGGLGQRPCRLHERVPSCDKGLREDFLKGKCMR